MMRRTILPLMIIFTIFTLIQCEVDDICTEEVLTPRLNIKFYDANESDDTELSVSNLTVWAEEKDLLYDGSTADTILLPLNPYAVQTVYILKKDAIIDTVKINYTVTPVFVSRSCGYKYNFTLEAIPEYTKHWINALELIEQPQQVEDEKLTHIKIYH